MVVVGVDAVVVVVVVVVHGGVVFVGFHFGTSPPVSGNGDDFSIFRRRQISTCYRPAAGENLGNCTCF